MAVRCKLSAVDLDVLPEKATKVMRTLCPPEYVCRIVFKNETDPIFEMDSLYLGDVDVVKAVHSSLECMNIIQLVRPFRSFHNLLHLPQSPSLTRVPQVDAQLFFIPTDPEKRLLCC